MPKPSDLQHLRPCLRKFLVLMVVGLVVCCGSAFELQLCAADDAIQYERDVAPILQNRCLKCHSRQKRAGKLNLSTIEGLARGGDSGPSVVPGNVEESFLWQRVAAGDMPPEEPLPDTEREILRSWIQQGATGLPEQIDMRPGADHWAFRPPVSPPLPQVASDALVRNEVDRFILATLEARGLGLSPQADRATLIRRVSIDVTGLPPTPDEIATFATDESPDAYERMVDRYLASPRYGEHWGRRWLDAAGYADSNGYFNADSDRPLAYQYRDYVIRSLNADKPFARFIQEQFAGDELVGYVPDGDVLPEMVDPLIATHFLRNAQDGTGESDGNPDELMLDRLSVIEGTVQIIGSSMLGLTLQCARCHDHKFEPITTAEYYQLQAVFFNVYCPTEWRKPGERVIAVGTIAEREEHRRRTEELEAQIARFRESVAGFATPLKAQVVEERLAELPAEEREPIQAALAAAEADRTDEQKKLLDTHKKQVDVSDDELAKRFEEFDLVRKTVEAKVAELRTQLPPPLPQIAIATDWVLDPPVHHVMVRGDFREAGPEAPAGVPALLTTETNGFRIDPVVAKGHGAGRRLALAQWFTAPEHPLLARVTVNRIWQQCFGTGIVASSENFGYTGADPSHPELLDYLATRLSQSGSFKAIVRLILCSATYRQSSAMIDAAYKDDPNDQLLWRFPVRRLEAEVLRDAMLAVSGELDGTMAGPYVPTERTADGTVVVKAEGALRRSIYLQQRRTQVLSFLDVFDAPSIVTNCTRRSASTIPLQSLSLLNSEFSVARAAAFEQRLQREAGADARNRLDRAFLLALGRAPRTDERQLAEQFLASQPATYGDSADDAQERAWVDLCQMLLASNQFLYLE